MALLLRLVCVSSLLGGTSLLLRLGTLLQRWVCKAAGLHRTSLLLRLCNASLLWRMGLHLLLLLDARSTGLPRASGALCSLRGSAWVGRAWRLLVLDGWRNIVAYLGAVTGFGCSLLTRVIDTSR